MRHEKQNARAGGDAGESSGEHAYESPDVDEKTENGKAAEFGENPHGGGAGGEIFTCDAQAEHLGISTEDENGSREKGALNYGARNCFERVARFSAERGGTFETDETKEGQDEAQPQAAASHAAKVELLPVEVPAVAE